MTATPTARGAVRALVADRLVDGTGRDPVARAAVVWEDGRIVAAGPRDTVDIPAGAQVIEGDDLTVLPGLMDMHVHLGARAGVDLGRMLMTPPSLELLHCVPNCAATLRAGVTTVRDAGATPAGVKLAVERGFFPGPRMEVAVQILSQTGGHGEVIFPSGACVPFGAAIADLPSGVVDGPDEMRRTVRTMLRVGADWIKLCTSGGVLSPGDLPDTPQFTVEEIAVAVHEAGVQGKRCMAHAMSPEGIKNALRAGVATIEHGSLLDEEGIELMLERRAWLVPTLVAPRDVLDGAERHRIPEEMVAKARRVAGLHRQAITAAVEAGVRIAMGTDSGVGEHGGNLRELPLMVECGMTPMQAIVASTRSCAELLGVEDRVGTLAAGMLADVVAVRGDPVADIRLFDDPDSVCVVVKGGEVVRDTR